MVKTGMYFTAEGIVVRQTDVGESDKVLTILTAQYGKISVWAKGARRMKSQKLAASSLLAYSRFSLGGSAGRYYISSAQPLETFYELGQSVEKMALACYIAEVSAYVSDENIPNPELLSLLLNALHVLAKDKKEPDYIKPAFELRCLAVCGHMPDLVGCRECMCYEGELYFALRGGALLCGDCLRKGGTTEAHIPVPAAILTAMRYIIYSDAKKVFSFTLSEEGKKILAHMTESYLEAQLNHVFSTLAFLKSVT